MENVNNSSEQESITTLTDNINIRLIQYCNLLSLFVKKYSVTVFKSEKEDKEVYICNVNAVDCEVGLLFARMGSFAYLFYSCRNQARRVSILHGRIQNV